MEFGNYTPIRFIANVSISEYGLFQQNKYMAAPQKSTANDRYRGPTRFPWLSDHTKPYDLNCQIESQFLQFKEKALSWLESNSSPSAFVTLQSVCCS